MVLKENRGRMGAAPVLAAVPGDRTIGEQEVADVKGMEAVFERISATREILAVAEERDAVADARDLAADRRGHDLDLAQFLAVDGDYGHDWPERRAAALDRQHAKQDRTAARRDRMALAQNWPWTFDHAR